MNTLMQLNLCGKLSLFIFYGATTTKMNKFAFQSLEEFITCLYVIFNEFVL